MKKVQKLRQKIDEIDRKLVDLIGERTRLALHIGEEKVLNREGIYSPDREMDVYRKIMDRNSTILPEDSLRAIFREIMSAALAAEKGVRVAYLGPVGTFTHQACIQKFGASVEYLSQESISDVFLQVEKGAADYGVIPIENTTEGAVTHTFDMFMDSDLKICSEVLLRIRHSLLSKFPAARIDKVYSNPQVFGQCRSWLKSNLSHADQIEVSSTSKAAQIAASQERSAAISSRLAAQIYGLKVVAEGIEDFKTNVTRFLVIGRHEAKRTGKDKTSILFSIKDRVGALYDVLLPFKKNRINLTKIESRPSKRKAWEYYFFVDFAGHQEDADVKKALRSLERYCNFVKILGSFPFVARE